MDGQDPKPLRWSGKKNMNKNNFKILIAGWIGVMALGIFSFSIVSATNPSLFISPSSLEKKVGETFVLTTTVDTADAKVCALEGELQLDSKLSCQSIVLGEGIMVQKQPTCADLAFLLGIPNCSTADKTLFTITVKAQKEGVATANFKNVDVIGEGLSLSNASVGGNYTLRAVATVKPSEIPVVPVVTPVVTPEEDCVCEDWGEWEGDPAKDCGQGGCEVGQLLQIRERTCSPVACDLEVENRCEANSYCVAGGSDLLQTASVLDTIGGTKYGWPIGGVIVIILIAGGIYFFSKKRK